MGGMSSDNVANIREQKAKDGWIFQIADDTSNILMHCKAEELSHSSYKSWDGTSVLLRLISTSISKKRRLYLC